MFGELRPQKAPVGCLGLTGHLDHPPTSRHMGVNV